jgi:hypothetical protein
VKSGIEGASKRHKQWFIVVFFLSLIFMPYLFGSGGRMSNACNGSASLNLYSCLNMHDVSGLLF